MAKHESVMWSVSQPGHQLQTKLGKHFCSWVTEAARVGFEPLIFVIGDLCANHFATQTLAGVIWLSYKHSHRDVNITCRWCWRQGETEVIQVSHLLFQNVSCPLIQSFVGLFFKCAFFFLFFFFFFIFVIVGL